MPDIEIDNLLLIVVGGQLRAEAADRPLAYRLLEAVQAQLHQQIGSTDWPIEPLVCTDILYMNQGELQARPTISIGGPGVNAVSAYLYQKLPTALAIEDKLVVQLDVDFADFRGAIWGVDAQHTLAALELFEQKYLPEFINALLRDIEE
jgi:hypothetical protein